MGKIRKSCLPLYTQPAVKISKFGFLKDLKASLSQIFHTKESNFCMSPQIPSSVTSGKSTSLHIFNVVTLTHLVKNIFFENIAQNGYLRHCNENETRAHSPSFKKYTFSSQDHYRHHSQKSIEECRINIIENQFYMTCLWHPPGHIDHLPFTALI